MKDGLLLCLGCCVLHLKTIQGHQIKDYPRGPLTDTRVCEKRHFARALAIQSASNIALRTLKLCSESLSSQRFSSPEDRFFFTDTGIRTAEEVHM